jgi:hypothetical protein
VTGRAEAVPRSYRFSGELDLFPAGHIPFVTAGSRELRDRQPPGPVDDRGLGPRTAEGASGVDQVLQIAVSRAFHVEVVDCAQKPGQLDQPRDRVLVRGVVIGGSRVPEPDGALTGIVTHAEEEVGLAERPRCH